MTPKPAPTKEFFYEHFIKPQQWTTTADCVDYRLVRDGEKLLIVFQQSQGLECYNGRKDWLRNFKVLWESWKLFKTFNHKGFLNAAKKIYYNELFEKVISCIYEEDIKVIDMAFYSQGSGIGLLVYALFLKAISHSYALRKVKFNNPICFAPPAVTWCLFSWRMSKYLKNVRLVRTRKDIVPKILKWLGYRHIGKVEYLEEPKGFKHPEHIPAWIRATYHYPEYYMACLPSEKEYFNEMEDSNV